MENASKALIIAGGVLMAILVMTVIINGWNKMSNYKKIEEESQKLEQLTEFNKEFESYNKGIVRGYELISLFNLAVDTNEQYSGDNGAYKPIVVKVKFMEGTTAVTNVEDDRKRERLTDGYLNFETFMSGYYLTREYGLSEDIQGIIFSM